MNNATKAKSQLVALIAAAVCLCMAFALAGCGSSSDSKKEETTTEKTTLQIFAANSLSKAMGEAQKAYIEDGHSNIEFADTQYKASGELVEMLGAGSYADLFISASKGTMDDADKKELIDNTTRKDMFKNDLVIVTKESSDINEVTLDDIAAGKYSICVGDDSVPAGNYAAQSLSTVGVYTPSADDAGKTGKDISGKGGSYTDSIKVVTDTSVGNVCKHAESGDVDVSFVYTSDVYRFGGVKIVGTVPSNTHKSIVYPAAITKDCKNKEATQEFYDWCMTNKKAQEIWQKWGFELA